MLINKPCAYCGTTTTLRTKGHVFSSSLYPNDLSSVNRITVPECHTCKQLWEYAEPQFRNILVSIWDPEQLPIDSRSAKMWRSFEKNKPSLRELAALLKPAENLGCDRYKIYPAEDKGFNQILRRIVRGLAHYHELGTAIADSQVTCGAMLWDVPPAVEQHFTWHTIATDFIAYAYAKLDEPELHSFWLLRFSRHILFFGYVTHDIGESTSAI